MMTVIEPDVSDVHAQKEAEAKTVKRQSRGIVIGVCFAFLLMLSNLTTGLLLVHLQSDYHASSIAKSNEIIAAQTEHANTLNQVHKLAMDIDGLVALEPAVKSSLTAGQNYLIAQLDALCRATGANCPGAP